MNAIFWGRSTCDFTYRLKGFPAENNKVFASDFIIQPGGPALNAALTFSKYNGSAYLISGIGNNNFGKSVKDILTLNNIKILDNSDDNFEIPISTVFINSRSSTRTIINSPYIIPSENFKNEKIYGIIEHVKPDLILIDGYGLENAVEVFEYAKNKKIKIVLDGGSWKENSNEYFKYVDIAICSGKFRTPGLSLDETISFLHEIGIKYVAFTNEENPIISSIDYKKEFIPVDKVKTVDTLGAGDVMHGSFCFHYLKNKNFNLSLKKAAVDASNSCRYFGTHTWWDYK